MSLMCVHYKECGSVAITIYDGYSLCETHYIKRLKLLEEVEKTRSKELKHLHDKADKWKKRIPT